MSAAVLPLPLKRARAHEVHGAGAVFFALAQAAMGQGAVLWVRPAWQGLPILPTGAARFFDPHRLIVARTGGGPEGHVDTLAVAEEGLRSGAAPLVIFEVDQPIDLTAGRRLQLAAKAGCATALAIIREGMGSNAAQTRWHCLPCFDPEAGDGEPTLQSWHLTKNKAGLLGRWQVRWDATRHQVQQVLGQGRDSDPRGHGLRSNL